MSKRGFTLVELLVVIGILILLVGILLPVLVKVMKQSQRTRVASDLNAISLALEEYKKDFYDYPRLTYTSTTPLNGTGAGADLLGKSLLSPGGVGTFTYSGSSYSAGQFVFQSPYEYQAKQNVPAGNAPGPGSPYWQLLILGSSVDGADGPGQRLRAGGFGQVYPPYLQADKFKMRGLSILDYFGNPILYYPANPAKPIVTSQMNTGSFGSPTGNSLIGTSPGIAPGAAPVTPTVPCVSMYNYSDNDTNAVQAAIPDTNIPNTFPDITVVEAMLGNYAHNGYINPGETANSTTPFLLWSAGPDGVFGPVEAQQNLSNFNGSTSTQIKGYVAKCDDVTNFAFGK
ncbi:MAG: prepilin-type N-terminal cleavage/methylation domain-containing protein [Phycisphaerae bacterium]|nr:prepilin-type N-terminal cleavage/methylation domain-containing protein [Phycisphaerae bacterium]